MSGKRCESFVVTIDDNNEINVLDELELKKYALKADVSRDGSKYNTVDHIKGLLEPKYNPWHLVQLLDLYTYHASCVDAVSVDASGISYTLMPIEGVEPVEAEKERFKQLLDECSPNINTVLQRAVYDRRAIGYGAIEVIRESSSSSDVVRLKHIPAHTLRRHSDNKRVVYTDSMGQRVWFVLYGQNYDENGDLCDISADDGSFHPYNSLPEEQRANEILWTMEYAPGTDYYGRPPIVSCLGSIKGDIGAVRYNNSFFENYGMPRFAVTVVGAFADYDVKPDDPEYDFTKTLRYRIGEQIKEVIRNPHSAICITIPSDEPDANIELKITPLSVQTEEGHFRLYRKDVRDEVIHSHHVDPSRLGIYDAGTLNGTNSDNTRDSYKYGTVAPIKAECEALVQQIAIDLGITSWRFTIVDVSPIDYEADLKVVDFLFSHGAMTIMDLIEKYGEKFGLNVSEQDNLYYLNARYIDGKPLEQIWNESESNPYLELDTILDGYKDE